MLRPRPVSRQGQDERGSPPLPLAAWDRLAQARVGLLGALGAPLVATGMRVTTLVRYSGEGSSSPRGPVDQIRTEAQWIRRQGHGIHE